MEGFHQSHSGEEGGEGLSVLPRHTKVLVTGNNRTKSVLVGLQGVVTKAVGLGGWHWLVKFSLIELLLVMLYIKVEDTLYVKLLFLHVGLAISQSPPFIGVIGNIVFLLVM